MPPVALHGRNDREAASTPEPTTFQAPPPAWTKSPDPLAPPTREVPAELGLPNDDGLDPDRRRWRADLRVEAVLRATVFNAAHADEAFQRRYRQPLGVNAVALLFEVPRDQHGRRLRLDRRYYPAERRTGDPADVIHALAEVVYAGWAGRGFNVRELATHHDERWHATEVGHASFFGAALSCLDEVPRSGSWAKRHKRVDGVDALTTCSLVQCVDGGRMLIRQNAGTGGRTFDRAASANLNAGGYAPFTWRRDDDLNRLPVDDPFAGTWHALAELCRMIFWGVR